MENNSTLATPFAPIDEVRKNLEESGDVHLQAIARLDSARLAKLAEWIRGLDKE